MAHNHFDNRKTAKINSNFKNTSFNLAAPEKFIGVLGHH